MSHLIAKCPQSPHFLLRGHTCHNVASEAADDECLLGREIELPNHQGDDRCKGVPVIKTERSHAMAAPTKIHRLIQPHLALMSFFPELFRRLMAVGRRLMQGIFGLAENCILRSHHLPVKVCQPASIRRHDSMPCGLFLGFFDLFQFLDARTLQKALSCLRIHRLRHETILNRQPFGHQFTKERVIQEFGINGSAHTRLITRRSFPCNP